MSHFASPVSRSVSPHDGARLGRAEDGRLGRRRSSHSPVCSPSWSPSSHPRWRIPRCCRCLSGTWPGRRRKAAEQMVRVNPCALLTMINDNMSSLPIVNYYYLCNWCRFILYLISELSLTRCVIQKRCCEEIQQESLQSIQSLLQLAKGFYAPDTSLSLPGPRGPSQQVTLNEPAFLVRLGFNTRPLKTRCSSFPLFQRAVKSCFHQGVRVLH